MPRPVDDSGRPVDPVYAVSVGTDGIAQNTTGTRSYNFSTGQAIAISAANVKSAAITATEVLLHAGSRCYINVGADPVATAGTGSMPLEAGEKFHLKITSGHKVGVIRDTADSTLFIIPVA